MNGADPELTWTVVARAHSNQALREHAFVLRAVGIPHRVDHAGGGVVLSVPTQHAARASQELSEYAVERATPRPREELPPIPRSAIPSAILYGLLLTVIYALERNGAWGLDWWRGGMSDAERVIDGEWWRAATALTLHTDVPHLGGNILFGAIYGVLFAQLVGTGAAWSATFLAGTLGNLANAWVAGEGHRSVGASTAVFGALGCLVAYEWRRRARLNVRLPRRLAPPLLGLVLLGWFGVGGERTDVGAHVWGMLSGSVIGGLIGTALAMRRGALPWGPRVQVGLTVGTLGALAGAWALALG